MRRPVQGDAPTKRPSVDIWKILENIWEIREIWKILDNSGGIWKNSGKFWKIWEVEKSVKLKIVNVWKSLGNLEIWEIWSVEQALAKR